MDYKIRYGQAWIKRGFSPSLHTINMDITLWSASIVAAAFVPTRH